MPILTIAEFSKLKNKNKAILALDVGQKKIGLAISDPSWMIASPYKTIFNRKFTLTLTQLQEIISKYDISGLVIGVPFNENGISQQEQSIKQFARNIDKMINIPICFIDENYSSREADGLMSEYDLGKVKKYSKRDCVAAQVILNRMINNYSYSKV